MYSSSIFLALACCLLAQPSSSKRIAESLFKVPVEPSALVLLDNDLLVGADDEGSLFFVNTTDPDMWWHTLPVQGAPHNNWEGIAVDTGDEVSNHLYLLFEGEGNGLEPPPQLVKVEYELGTPNSYYDDTNQVTVVSTVDLTEFADGDLLSEEDGLESLTLYKPSNGTETAEFLVGVQKTGELYSIKGDTGEITESVFLPATNRSVVSGSVYLPDLDVLMIVGDDDNRMQAIDVTNDCVLGSWPTQMTAEEGLAFDLENGYMYVADDDGGLDRYKFDLNAELEGKSCGAEEDEIICPETCSCTCEDGMDNGNNTVRGRRLGYSFEEN